MHGSAAELLAAPLPRGHRAQATEVGRREEAEWLLLNSQARPALGQRGLWEESEVTLMHRWRRRFWAMYSYSFCLCPIESPWGARGGLPLKTLGMGLPPSLAPL